MVSKENLLMFASGQRHVNGTSCTSNINIQMESVQRISSLENDQNNAKMCVKVTMNSQSCNKECHYKSGEESE